MDNLEDYAGKLFDETYNENRRAIQMLRFADREKYEHLVSSGSNATPLQWRAPFSISFNCSEDSAEYDRHLFINETGICRVTLNAWESGVLKEEMHRADFVAWLRNLDRKNWSIEIPYKVSGVYKAMFPDMMIVRKDAHGYIFDILEPHDSSRSDNCAKAKGLAEFAQVKDFISLIKSTVSGSAQEVLDIWQQQLFENATIHNTDIVLTKKDVMWPLIVIMCDNERRGNPFIDDMDDGEYEEISERYKSFISCKCQKFSFVTRVISDYQSYTNRFSYKSDNCLDINSLT